MVRNLIAAFEGGVEPPEELRGEPRRDIAVGRAELGVAHEVAHLDRGPVTRKQASGGVPQPMKLDRPQPRGGACGLVALA